MDKAINFYELKTQLDDLGYTDPGFTDQLRAAVMEDPGLFTLYGKQQHQGTSAELLLNYEKTATQGYRLYGIEGFTPNLNIIGCLHMQYFRPDIGAAEVIRFLMTYRQQNTQHDPFMPLGKREVEIYLLNNKIMNTQNLDQLKKSLLNLGFGEKLNDQLEKNITAEMPEFTLNAQHEFNQKKVDYTLHFRAGEERYFFNSYDAKILNADPAKEISQTFKINKGNGISAKEAFNLMEGRAVEKLVFKDETSYHAWFQLDKEKLTDSGNKQMKQFHENYGYDIEKVLQGHGIKEMNEPKTTEDLLYSLKKGNVQQIHVDKNGEQQKYFISANPQFKTVDLFDHQMKKIKREELLQPEQKQSSKQNQSQQQKEDQTEKKQSRRSKMTV